VTGRRNGFTGLSVLGLLVGFAAGVALRSQPDRDAGASPADMRPVPLEVVETVLVLVVDPECGASTNRTLIPAWKRLVSALSLLDPRGRLWRVGIAVSSDPLAGFRFLEAFGNFEEVAAGGGWMNSAVRRYLSQDLPGPVAVPQVILIERQLVVRRVGAPATAREQILQRRVGLEDISRLAVWAERQIEGRRVSPARPEVFPGPGTPGGGVGADSFKLHRPAR